MVRPAGVGEFLQASFVAIVCHKVLRFGEAVMKFIIYWAVSRQLQTSLTVHNRQVESVVSAMNVDCCGKLCCDACLNVARFPAYQHHHKICRRMHAFFAAWSTRLHCLRQSRCYTEFCDPPKCVTPGGTFAYFLKYARV